MNDSLVDVPSPFDFRDGNTAREWADRAMKRRPWRAEFFWTIAQELIRLHLPAPSVLELGSGPGFLARCVLESLQTSSYLALDYSAPMHLLAKERLGVLGDRVRFLDADFTKPGWNAELPELDAVLSVQAVHELRHKRHAVSLYREVRTLLRDEGVLLICDHFAGEGGMEDTSLYMTLEEQERALQESGFTRRSVLLQKSGLILFRAAR